MFPKLSSVFAGLFALFFLLNAVGVLSCYCGIGFQSGYYSGSYPSGYASWTSPSTIGPTGNSKSSCTLTQYKNNLGGYTAGGLIWDTRSSNIYGNTFGTDANLPRTTWTNLAASPASLPATITNMVKSPKLTGSFYLPGTLSGCTIPNTQDRFVTSIQFKPLGYYETGNGIRAVYHDDSIFMWVSNPSAPSTLIPIPFYNDGNGQGSETFFSAQFALFSGTNTIYLAVNNTDVLSAADGGGCPFIYKYTVSCTGGSGAKGDPQFTGFLNQEYQIHGQSQTVYNVLSTPTFQYNALFSYLSSGRCRDGTLCFSHPGNYFGAVGVMLYDPTTDSTTNIKVYAGEVEVGMKVTMNDVEVTPSDNTLTIGRYTISHPNAFELFLESDELNLKVSNSDRFLNQDVSIGSGLLGQISQHKQMKRMNVTAAEEMEAKLPHGLLGQTWQVKRHNNRWKYIEGHLYDYIVDGLLGTSFRYNRFHTQ